jgi:hypothetical protein
MTTDFKKIGNEPATPNRERKRLLAYIVETDFPLAARQCCYKLKRFANQAILAARTRSTTPAMAGGYGLPRRS